MKESRFVELLNLYVDHELTQGEAAELEAELQRNPARRVRLKEYRALQRGCEVLFEADRSLAPRTAEVVRALRERRGEDSRPVRSGWGDWSWSAGAATAVAVAVIAAIVVGLPVRKEDSAATAAVATVSPAGAASTLEMWDVTVPASPEARGLRMRSLWVPASAEREPGSSFVAVASADLSWLDEVRLPAVRAPRPEELRFSERAIPVQAGESVPPSQRPLQATLEMTAFQFQR